MTKTANLAKTQQDNYAKIRRPTWSFYLRNRNASLHDAVALSMNISPRQIDSVIKDDAKKKKLFAARMRAAALEMNDSGFIKVVEKGRQDDKSDWIITLNSFVEFAFPRNWGANNKKFRMLGEANNIAASTRDNDKPEKSKRKAPDKFVAALLRLFVEIAKRASKQDMPFEVNALPGTKEDLWQLAIKYHPDLDKELRTFDDYLSGLCQFPQGRPTGKNDFYSNLFPELFNALEKLAK